MRLSNQNSNNNQHFKALSMAKKPLEQFYNANATIPTLIIETGVTLGRAYEANKRGGTPEAIDRLIEQGISAVVWIYGVNFLKNIGNFIGKKLLKIKDLNFDIGFDELRNPTKYIDKKALCFKASNILISTAIATYFIGSILPKINNLILDKTLKRNENKKSNKKDENKTIQQSALKTQSFKDFQQKTAKNIPFTSLSSNIVNSAHILENNSAARLLITDTGVILGRFSNAPNKYRKIEGLFRDISSIYFYLLATSNIVFGLNKLTNNTNIDPKALEKTLEMLSQKIKENPNMSVDDFLSNAIDKKNYDETLKPIFQNRKTVSVDEFIKHFPQFKQKALQMAKMQYIESGSGILSYEQAKDVLSSSWTSNPEFLKNTLKYATGKEIDAKTCFISSKKLNKTRASIDLFIENLSKQLKEYGKVDFEFIEKYANKTLRKSLGFNIAGTAISMFALGILIPKIQYAITRKLTNENKFHTEKE